MNRPEDQTHGPLKAPGRCPCCGLHDGTQSMFNICPRCDWLDDGQGDADADEIAGGPNGSYSLTLARQNFARFGSMYEPGGEVREQATSGQTRHIKTPPDKGGVQ